MKPLISRAEPLHTGLRVLYPGLVSWTEGPGCSPHCRARGRRGRFPVYSQHLPSSQRLQGSWKCPCLSQQAPASPEGCRMEEGPSWRQVPVSQERGETQ